MVITTTNGIRDKEGELRQRVAVDSLKAKLTMPGGVVLEFDSSDPNPPKRGTRFDVFLDLVKVNANASWSVLIDKENRIKSVDGRDRVLESLDQTKRELLKKRLDVNYLRDQANRELLRIPSQPVMPGDSWQLRDTMRLDGGQSLVLNTLYTYRGETERSERKLHQIDVDVKEVAYTIDADATLLKLMSSELRPAMMEGVIYFDADEGMVVESRESVQIEGDIQFSLDGNELGGHLELTLANSVIVE
jgi:hypothetical protein